MFSATRNLKQLLRTSAATNLRLLQKRNNVISGPPSRILSTGERILHMGVMVVSWLITPFVFFPNLKKIRGIVEEKPADEPIEDEDEEDE
ncbi:hypothetical protein Trydic_g6497 [Trypoxylus dichotomus]